MGHFTDILVTKSRNFQWLLAMGMVALIGVLEYRTEPELSLALLYLVPIFQATWFAGRYAGVFMSCISVAVWVLARSLATSDGHASLTFYWNALTQLGIFIIVTYVVSIQLVLKKTLEKEQKLARTDFLTGVMNRRAFSDILAAEVSRSARYDHLLSLAYIDLDNFKDVNDQHGHAVGDTVLQAVVHAIRKKIRSTDTVARLGGDEFVVLFPETGADAAERIIGDVHTAVAAAMRESNWLVTSSMGLATCMPPPVPPENIIKEAERLMYAAKSEGKNRIKGAVLPPMRSFTERRNEHPQRVVRPFTNAGTAPQSSKAGRRG
jgi:diguanylate cyclase (GGDEF)-like protein